ncbi:MAG: hypothetical protein H7175_08060 [Burkholderiales bacterium]|nr:hypothetical protein [Anaerolineae bacterium]
MIILRILAFVAGGIFVLWTLSSAIQSFVVPRSANTFLTRMVFVYVNKIFQFRMRWAKTYAQRDAIMALFAPITLLVLPLVWIACILIGYSFMYWGAGIDPFTEAVTLSGSSLLTLGYHINENFGIILMNFTEAAIGLGIVALLISYLPTMYSAFSRREQSVNMLEVRAGSPPWAITMIERLYRIEGFGRFHTLWEEWEHWFADIDETHTSLASLVFFRSPRPEHSWITAAGAVLDAAALYSSTLDLPRDPQAELSLRAGYLALRHIADFFRIDYNPNPKPDDPISITREEFDAAYDRMLAEGIPLKPDRDLCWKNFAGWRVNYDAPLLALCALVMAPETPWSSDRKLKYRPALIGRPTTEMKRVQ